MGESVQTVIRSRGATLRPGDAVVLNNPFNGGTHLPDLTVVTPVFDSDAGAEILFFVANRGHHADIGGLTPGSTPPNSTRLVEEGVVIDDFLLVEGGNVFHEAAVSQAADGAPYPARSPDTNIADIKAQVAANTCGVRELQRVVSRYGGEVVAAYMAHVMQNGEDSMRNAIQQLKDGSFDYEMDDGSPLRVAVRVDRDARAATIDFTGTGPQHRGKLQCAPGGGARGGAVRISLPGGAGYPAQ
jgi:5-oxoprolinase (ATP-hydrolysing)